MSDTPGRATPERTAFVTVAVFYMAAFLIDLMERWHDPSFNAIVIAALLAILAAGVGRWTLLAFVVASAAHVALARFPDASNHGNLYLFTSPFLVAALLAAPRRAAADEDGRLVQALFPLLRIALSVTYVCAGFHKLNADFLDPATSCGVGFFNGSRAAVGLDWVPLPHRAQILVAVGVIAWELGGGLLLWVRRLQLPVLLVCWLMHAVLAMKVFFDFSSMAFALMLSFVPPAQWAALARRPQVHLGPFRVRRLHLYVGANLIAGLVAWAFFQVHGYDKSIHKWQGLALNASFLVLVWPIIADLLDRRRGVTWSGVAVLPRGTPAWYAAFPLLLLLWAVSPYVGLRTTGTFTMFSNLMTEGPRSNHLLLGSNPLKIWGYQEDTVRIIAIDPRHAKSRRHELPGLLLPVVELKKRILAWGREGLDGLAATFEYGGRRYETADIVRDNPWQVERPDLEMRLLAFRPIDTSGRALRCRW